MNNLISFNDYLRSRGLAKRTVKTYISALRTFAVWLQHNHGEFNLMAVTALDIADYRRSLINQRKKPATVNLALDALNSFYTWSVTRV